MTPDDPRPSPRGTLARLAAVACVGVLLVVPLPTKGRASVALLDLAHAPSFALVALVALAEARARLGRSPSWLAPVVWAGLVVAGIGAEVVQGYTGRQPSVHDAVANAMGAAAGVLIGSARRASGVNRWTRLGLAAVLVAVPSFRPLLVLKDTIDQRRAMPMLASFESDAELSRWAFQECGAARSPEHATAGAWSLRLDLGPGVYPGAALVWPVNDWSGHAVLEFDAFLDGDRPLDLVVKLEDARRGGVRDRFHAGIRLAPGPNPIRIALPKDQPLPSGRRIDLGDVRLLQFFAIDLKERRTINLDNIRLDSRPIRGASTPSDAPVPR